MRFSASGGGAGAPAIAPDLRKTSVKAASILRKKATAFSEVKVAAAAAEASDRQAGEHLPQGGNGHHVVGMGMRDHGLPHVVRADAQLCNCCCEQRPEGADAAFDDRPLRDRRGPGTWDRPWCRASTTLPPTSTGGSSISIAGLLFSAFPRRTGPRQRRR